MAEPTIDETTGQRMPILAALAAVAVVLGLVLSTAGNDTKTSAPNAASASPTPSTTDLPQNFVEFRDEQGKFSISYPADWQRIEVQAEDYRLVATPNNRDSMLVRVIPMPGEISQEDVPGAKPILDQILRAQGAQILDARQVQLDNAQGWFYLYTFTDTETKQEGVHTHYFLFRGAQLHILVFQALPAEGFRELAPTFDKIAGSYQAL